MRMTTLKTSESNISTLLQRLYPNLSESKLKQAEMALLKANPHLTEAGDFRPGVVVTLPSDTGLKPKPGIVDELATQEETLKNKEVAAVIKDMPNAAELAKELTSSLRERKRAMAEEKKVQDELFARIGEDIAGIFK
jgi:hypothetical protein